MRPAVRRSLNLAITLAVLGVTGWLTTRWVAPTWREIRAEEPALRIETLKRGAGGGVMFGLLGGFRAIIADFLWVEMNSHWEAYDLPGTTRLIELVVTVDPRPLYFWINGARILAYDMPHWRLDAATRRPDGTEREIPLATRQRIEREQAWAGLELLDMARGVHPREPRLVLEQGEIHLRRLGDVSTGAEYYRLAATMPGAPYYAGRIYAELLKRLGRTEDAYRWLKALHPTLPPDDPLANADVVLERIRGLEVALKIPEALRYRAPAREPNPP